MYKLITFILFHISWCQGGGFYHQNGLNKHKTARVRSFPTMSRQNKPGTVSPWLGGQSTDEYSKQVLSDTIEMQRHSLW